VEDVVQQLARELGPRVLRDPETLATHSRDAWVLSELDALEGRPPAPPRAVVEAASTQDVSKVLALCREARVPVVTFGGGSGVCGGIRTEGREIVLSTRRLAGLRALDATNLTATFGSGTNGMRAEQQVREQGLTIGHWPQSIELSTVGGWVATRASGQFSTAYGNIEDLLLDLEVVLPDGSVLRTRRTPRASAGPDLRQLFLGSEGTLGVVSEVTFSLRPLPERSLGQSFHFADFDAGLAPIRHLMRAGHRPPVVRLYDPRESGRHFAGACPEGRAMLILLHEGAAATVAAEHGAVSQICTEAGGVPAGEDPVSHWLAERNRVPGFRSFLEKGIVLDTIEIACTWDRVAELYARTTAALAPLPGLLLASAHSSHSYRSGTNLYVTFVARPPRREDMPAVYGEGWRRVMEAALALGAGIAHHHGIGRVRRDFLAGEIGETGVALLRAVKRALDPEGLLNPGVLLPA
jgi:alkyldihydroxyacetonephosphate synthase